MVWPCDLNHLIYYHITESPLPPFFSLSHSLSTLRSTNDTTCALCEQYNVWVHVLCGSRSLLEENTLLCMIFTLCVYVWYPLRPIPASTSIRLRKKMGSVRVLYRGPMLWIKGLLTEVFLPANDLTATLAIFLWKPIYYERPSIKDGLDLKLQMKQASLNATHG